MPRRNNYKIIEGTTEVPVRIFARVRRHAKHYGAITLPAFMVGTVVEIIIPKIPIPDELVGKGENPIYRKKKKAVEVVELVESVAEATVEVSAEAGNQEDEGGMITDDLK